MGSNFGGYPPWSDARASEEFHLLCMLSNIGVIHPKKSLSAEEISEYTRMEVSTVKKLLPKLVQNGYIEISKTEFVNKYYVTAEGIRKVLSMYS